MCNANKSDTELMAARTSTIRLSQLFRPDSISLSLDATARDEILSELVSLLKLEPDSHASVCEMLTRRENLSSTGIGRGVAIPHCRTLHVPRLRAAYGRKVDGVEFMAVDEKPVYDFFLIVAPPVEISSDYLPTLGQVAQFVRRPDISARLAQLRTYQEFIELLNE